MIIDASYELALFCLGKYNIAVFGRRRCLDVDRLAYCICLAHGTRCDFERENLLWRVFSLDSIIVNAILVGNRDSPGLKDWRVVPAT